MISEEVMKNVRITADDEDEAWEYIYIYIYVHTDIRSGQLDEDRFLFTQFRGAWMPNA